MHTIISSDTSEVAVGDDRPTVLIGERIDPTGRKKLAASLEAGNMEVLCQEAVVQVEAGADILDVNVGSSVGDKVGLLSQVVQSIAEVVNVPLSLDSDNSRALEAALKVYRGKPIINSVTGQEKSLAEVLPLVREHGAAVITLTMDDEGIPADSVHRVNIAHKILEKATSLGIPGEDVIID